MLGNNGHRSLELELGKVDREFLGRILMEKDDFAQVVDGIIKVVEYARRIERKEKPNVPLIPILALRGKIIDLREEVFRDPSLVRLRPAMPYIEKVYGTVRQYAIKQARASNGYDATLDEEAVLNWLMQGTT